MWESHRKRISSVGSQGEEQNRKRMKTAHSYETTSKPKMSPTNQDLPDQNEPLMSTFTVCVRRDVVCWSPAERSPLAGCR